MIYTTGTIAGNGNTITGTGANFTAAGSLIRVGCTLIAFTNPVQVLQITAITSGNALSVTPAISPVIAAGTKYAILLSDSLSVDGLAQDIAETFGMYQRNISGFADVMNGSGDVTITIDGKQVTVPGQKALAKRGENSDITSLSGLTTALSILQGGTGATDAAGARTKLGLAGWGESLPIPPVGSALSDIKVTSLFNASLNDTTDFPTKGLTSSTTSDWGTVETFAYGNGAYGLQRVTMWQGVYDRHLFSRSWGPGGHSRWVQDVNSRNFPLATEETTQDKSWVDDPSPSTQYGGPGIRAVQYADGNGAGAGSPITGVSRPSLIGGYGVKIEVGAGLFGSNLVLTNEGLAVRTRYGDNAWGGWGYLLSDKNTAPDTNGFIKVASPIVKIFADGTAETNDESEGATVERLDVGQYIIDGVLGMNNDPLWGGIDGGFELPKDRNGQALVWLDYEVKADGSILVKTYHRTYPNAPAFARNVRDGVEEGDPVDIPTGLFVSARVEMPHDSIYNKAQETGQKAMKEAGQLAAEEAARKATEEAQTDPDQPQS